jgi:hypothetical protein
VGEENMNEQEVNEKFDALVQTKAIKEKKEPAKFPELRYLWGMTLLGSFILVVITTLIISIIEAL